MSKTTLMTGTTDSMYQCQEGSGVNETLPSLMIKHRTFGCRSWRGDAPARSNGATSALWLLASRPYNGC